MPRWIKLALAAAVVAGAIWAVTLGPLRLGGLSAPRHPVALRSQDFGSNPGWQGRNNHRLGACTTTRQDFDRRPPSRAGGLDGAIGGLVTRSLRPAYFARPASAGFDRPFRAEGVLLVRRVAAEPFDSAGAMIGFFNHADRDWRPPNAALVQVNTDRVAGGDYSLSLGYSSRDYHAGTQDLLGPGGGRAGLRFGQRYRWRMAYDPAAAGGTGELTLAVAGVAAPARLALGAEARIQGAWLDRFGLASQARTRGRGVELYLGDLRVDGVPQHPDRDRAWQGRDNHVSWHDCFTGRPDFFGWTGPRDRRLGGLISRTEEKPPGQGAFYADRVGRLSLDDRLHAEGTVRLERANSDSATLLGWFDPRSSGEGEAQSSPPDFVGLAISGPTRIGQYFGPLVADRRGRLAPEKATGIVFNPGPGTYRWTLDYFPDRGRAGQVRVRLGGRDATVELAPKLRAAGARLTRFGMRTVERGGSFQVVYFDDLRYTVERGKPGGRATGAKRRQPTR